MKIQKEKLRFPLNLYFLGIRKQSKKWQKKCLTPAELDKKFLKSQENTFFFFRGVWSIFDQNSAGSNFLKFFPFFQARSHVELKSNFTLKDSKFHEQKENPIHFQKYQKLQKKKKKFLLGFAILTQQNHFSQLI